MVDLKLQFPEGFFDEEGRCGYVVTKKMKEVWAVELDLFAEFDRVCKKYDIQYFASSGTMLGAVRHHGFIPWDDDMDVMLMRDQYIKLCEVAEKEFKSPYFFQTEYTDKGSMRGHAQLRNSMTTAILASEAKQKFKFNQGIFFDIFPLDAVPDDAEERKAFLEEIKEKKQKAQRVASLTCNYRPSANILKRPIKYILHKCLELVNVDCDKYYREFENTCQRYNEQDTEYIDWISFIQEGKRKRKNFQTKVNVPFEFLTIPICEQYNQALTERFGDWHKFVKGASIHGGTFFDPNKSYTEYL